MARALSAAKLAGADATEAIAFADAALAVAGHEVTDAWSRELIERVARRDVTGDEAVAEMRRHFQS
ncbi:MAG: hypothetical protein LBK95_16275 [Bifidobacteriaceae bacterium]|jgi:hypothetical protein|nr:hypothetical protein [Bifidobacteriaceae bacterium]